METSFMDSLFSEVCLKNGLVYHAGPVAGVSGEIISTNGKRIHFFNCCFDINPYGSSMFARNKGLTRICLERMNFAVPKGVYYSWKMGEYKHYSKEEYVDAIKRYCSKTLNLPVMIKGADIHRGKCVYKIDNWNLFENAIEQVLEMTCDVVVEEYIDYCSYRVLVYDGEVVACYRKEPFFIIGDGILTAEALINMQHKYHCENSIGMSIEPMLHEIREHLAKQGYSMTSVVKKGERIALTDTDNISKGGIATDYTSALSLKAKAYVKGISECLNLKLCGIDLIIRDISKMPSDTYILEVNSSPDLEGYSLLGQSQKKRILSMLEEIVLDSLAE